MVVWLNLATLQLRRAAAKATFMYRIKWGQVEVKSREGVLTLKTRIFSGHLFQYILDYSPDTVSYKMSFFPSATRL